MNTLNNNTAEVAPGLSERISGAMTDSIYQLLSSLGDFMSPEHMVALSKTLATFIFIFAELSLLFLVISYVIALLQAYIPPEKIKHLLSRKKGVFIAALLGSITPFCSCSTIPFLKGLIRANAGFSGIIVFLLASPLLNPIILGLFFISFGLKVAVYYFVVAMFFSILAGLILDKLGFEKYVRPIESESDLVNSCCAAPQLEVASACCDEPSKASVSFSAPIASCCSSEPSPLSFKSVEEEKSDCCSTPKPIRGACFSEISKKAWRVALGDFRQAFIFMLIGVLIGAVIYGFVPDTFIAKHAGGDSPFAVPIAAVVGVPLYVRAEVVIPISLGLVGKGMSLGAVMSFIIGSAGASLTEVILLKSLFKNPIIYAFLITVFSMAIMAGFLLPVFL